VHLDGLVQGPQGRLGRGELGHVSKPPAAAIF